MKKLMILFSLLLFCSEVFAAENLEKEPKQNFDDNRAVVSVQKQPSKENKQTVKRNWFCIVVQVNGKIKDDNTALQNTKQ